MVRELGGVGYHPMKTGDSSGSSVDDYIKVLRESGVLNLDERQVIDAIKGIEGGMSKTTPGSGKVPMSENESFQITQRQWERLMGNEPFKQGDVRRIMEFANRLSEERGLRPVYDLSIEGEVRINAPGGDIYQAEGFRLPTEADLAISELVESIVPEFKWLIHDGIVDSNSPFLFKLVRGNL